MNPITTIRRTVATTAALAALAIGLGAGGADAASGSVGPHSAARATCGTVEIMSTAPTVKAVNRTAAVDQQWVVVQPVLYRWNGSAWAATALRQVENEVLAGDTDAARAFLAEASAVASRLGDVGTLDLALRRWRAVLADDESALEAVVVSARAHHALLEVARCCDALVAASERRGATQRASGWRAERDAIAGSLAITAFSAVGGRFDSTG